MDSVVGRPDETIREIYSGRDGKTIITERLL